MIKTGLFVLNNFDKDSVLALVNTFASSSAYKVEGIVGIPLAVFSIAS